MTLALFEQLDLFQSSWGFRPPRQVWNHPGVDVAYEWGYLPFIAKELVPLCCFCGVRIRGEGLHREDVGVARRVWQDQ